MKGICLIFSVIAMFIVHAADAASTRAMRSGTTAVERIASPTAGYNYNYMYPYLNNDMRVALNPGVTTSQSTSPINAVVRTEQLSAPRRVVARSTSNPTTNVSAATAAARSAANNAAAMAASARAATTTGTGTTQTTAAPNTNTNRRVVARAAAPQSTTTSVRTSRVDNSASSNLIGPVSSNRNVVSSSRCLADYTDCMDDYCKRENTRYNRCYCSSKLAQIDSQYKNQIDDLAKKLITVRNGNAWTDAEFNEYWMSVIGKYTGENSWVNLENALDINWADLESRVRGQQAFTTGHEYCARNLSNCFYMAGNLRDAYVSQIGRDCQAYEQTLQLMKNALESAIGNYE